MYKKYQSTPLGASPTKPLVQIQNNFTEMFHILSFANIAQMAPLLQTRWPSEL